MGLRIAFCAALLGLLAGPPPLAGGEQTVMLPDGKRTYELLLPPDADKLKNAPLVVYLHGSAGSKLAEFKKDWWPLLAARKCIVAVPLSKAEHMWAVGEDTYVRQVIADVQKRRSVDPQRRMLLGVSGGGQLALFLADRTPEAFRAVIVVSANPVVSRSGKAEWFFPDPKGRKTCPYFVVCHITHGASLKFWRQVRARLEGKGASISILPVLGEPAHYLAPPKELGGWLDAVLAGKHPVPIEDPQKAAVAKTFAKPAAALFDALKTAGPAKVTEKITKEGKQFALTVPRQEKFERSKREADTDAGGEPVTEVRTEHEKWPIYVRVDARLTKKPLKQVVAAEQEQTRLRGMLYQVYHAADLALAGRTWQVKIGSITFPDKRRGWRTTLFVHAAAPVASDPRQWIEITIMDETQEPDPNELAPVFRTILAHLAVRPK